MKQNQKIKGLKFQPWIGENYETNPKGRILLLGESHYLNGEKETSDFTTQVVNNFKNHFEDFNSPFFERIGKIFDSKDCFKIWNNVAFANLIQSGLDKAKTQPLDEDWETINPAFEKLLAALKPDKVIVFSKRIFNYCLNEDDAICLKEIKANNKKAEIYQYTRNQHKSFVIGVNHASRMFGNSCLDWTPLIKKFIDETYL